MPINYSNDPKPSIKAGLFGQPKRGKTHNMCSLALTAFRELDLAGNIACIATENWVPDWAERLRKHSGKQLAICQTRSPAEALKFAMECEASKEISMLLIDCASDLVQLPRDKFIADKGRPPKGAEYTQIDLPFNRFVRWCADTQLHWIATLREEDERQEVDGNEVIIGKTGKGKFSEVPRLQVHCQLARAKNGSSDFVAHVTDTGGSHATYSTPTSEHWAKHLERYK